MRAIMAIALTLSLLTGPLPMMQRASAQTSDVNPVSIRIPSILVDTTIEPLSGDPDPTGTWTVGWYADYGQFGSSGNTVLHGYRDFWGSVGPSVFYFFNQIGEGDSIQILGSDDLVYEYEVASVESQPIASAEVEDIFGESANERLTLFGYGGEFDDRMQNYDATIIVVAIPTGPPVENPETPTATIESQDCPVTPREIQLLWGSNITHTTPASARSLIDAFEMQNTTITDQSDVESINEFLTNAAGCEVVARSALTLPDERILALVGPSGQLPLDLITVEDLDDMTEAQVKQFNMSNSATRIMAFAIFTLDGDAWTAEGVPYR